MWSRVRHRRLQALSLVVLAALLSTSLCLGPLYQRAMEQGLAGSVLGDASPIDRSLRVTSEELSISDLERDLPASVTHLFGPPLKAVSVPVSVALTDTDPSLATRLYAVTDACRQLEVVDGACPTRPGEVMVSTEDQRVNGWQLGTRVRADQRVTVNFDGPEVPSGKVTVVGVYKPDPDDDWLGAPLVGRAGRELQDVGAGTDDWVTTGDTLTGTSVAAWYHPSASVAWTLASTDYDDLLRVGPVIGNFQHTTIQNANSSVRVETTLPKLAEQVADGGEQGRTTVVVLVVQLIVLVAVVLWMVLVAATDDRRPELALARLRGRGRRGAMTYLLAELLPVPLVGVALGVLVSPLVMSVVARVIFPVPVPRELPGGYLLAALGSLVAVTLVVLVAARRAVREPVDSLLRAVQSRHVGTGTGVAEVALIVFSLTAVVALVTGNLEGPLATLAPTLLAVAVGLLLGRALAPAVRFLSVRLLRSGRAVAAAGIVNAVRRPAARRVLVMVVVASALLVFCADAVLTGQHNRQNAAEQANGAHYVLEVQPARLRDVVDAVKDVDPDGRHLTAVVSTPITGNTGNGPTLGVDPTGFQHAAYFPLSSPTAGNWDGIHAPDVEPHLLQGSAIAGSISGTRMRFEGPSTRYEDVQVQLQLIDPDGESHIVPLAVIPRKDGSAPLSGALPCAEGCTITGLSVITPPGLRVSGSITFQDITVDGAAFSLGATGDYRRVINDDGSMTPAADPSGQLSINVTTTGSEPPVMFSTWVPDPVPALVTGPEESIFDGPGLEDNLPMIVAGRLPRVPGSPLASRVVDVNGLLRRPGIGLTNDLVSVWSDDAGALADAKKALREHGVVTGDETSVEDVRAALDASPAAWSLALSVLVGGAAVLVAMLVMIVATATSWRARATDLAALRMAGLGDRALRRMELLAQLPVVVVGALAGSACGTVAAVLALPGIRQFTDPPAIDTTDFATPWSGVLGAALAALVLLTALAVVSSRWTARRAPLNRIREVV